MGNQKDMTTIPELAKKIEQMIESVKSGLPTQYTTFDNENTTWKIRVANHDANPERTDKYTISFIVPIADTAEQDDDTQSPFHVNKKTFNSMPGQYVIIDGCDENGYSIEELLTYNID